MLDAVCDGQVYIAGLESDADAMGDLVPETGRNRNGETVRPIIIEISIYIGTRLVSQ